MKQTFIVYLESLDGTFIDFERFACKRVSTVIKHIRKLWESELYRVCTKGAEVAKIYATPDGYNKEPEPIEIVTL